MSRNKFFGGQAPIMNVERTTTGNVLSWNFTQDWKTYVWYSVILLIIGYVIWISYSAFAPCPTCPPIKKEKMVNAYNSVALK